MTGRRAPFVVLALPRSRTFWLSHFLAFGGRKVGHDQTVYCQEVEDFFGPLESGKLAGTCETAGMLAWRLLVARMPEAKVLVVRREVEQVRDSLLGFGLGDQTEELLFRDALLEEASHYPGVLSVNFADLVREAACQQVFEFCLEEDWNREWWVDLAGQDLQIDMSLRLEYLLTHWTRIQRFKDKILLEQRTWTKQPIRT